MGSSRMAAVVQFFFFSSRRRHTRFDCDWSSDVCSSDLIVGKILAGWRYDISGLAPEMRGDYEEHFAACERCRSKQRLHRTIDVSLIALASVSAGVFLLAFGVIRHFGPQHAFILELAALAGLARSGLFWLFVTVGSPPSGNMIED